MPTFWGGKAKQDKMLNDIVGEFREVQRKYNMPPGDFPKPNRFRGKLESGLVQSQQVPKIET